MFGKTGLAKEKYSNEEHTICNDRYGLLMSPECVGVEGEERPSTALCMEDENHHPIANETACTDPAVKLSDGSQPRNSSVCKWQSDVSYMAHGMFFMQHLASDYHAKRAITPNAIGSTIDTSKSSKILQPDKLDDNFVRLQMRALEDYYLQKQYYDAHPRPPPTDLVAQTSDGEEMYPAIEPVKVSGMDNDGSPVF